MKKEIAGTFVIPVYIKEGNTEYLGYFKQTMNSIFNQTCSDWSVVIVDNDSQNRELDEYVNTVIQQREQTILYRHNDRNMGTAGMPRNIGVKVADEELKSDIILFLDSDDLAHPMRLEKTKEIFGSTDADLVYSSFHVIDEYGNAVSYDKMPLVMRLIQMYLIVPPEGKEVWKSMFTGKGFLNLPSVTSLRIELAKKVPFPEGRKIMEDTYVNTMYAAHGANFHFAKEIPVGYRIPQVREGTSSMNYLGKKEFYHNTLKTLLIAFYDSTQYMLNKGTVTLKEVEEILPMWLENMTGFMKTFEADGIELLDIGAKLQELKGNGYQHFCACLQMLENNEGV